jgi:antitoxin component of RelBE/YafQ-DinJ toxin-antitoxin module
MQEKRLTIKVDKSLKDAFLATAKSKDTTGSQAVRDFMRNYIRENSQRSLFSGTNQ